MAHSARAIRKFLALDIETAKVLPDGADLRSQRPLGICCAAVLAEGDDQPKHWYSVNPDGTPSAQISARDTCQLLDFLGSQVAAGFTILSWNGLGFDFDILAEESGRHDLCRQLAVAHVDLMFHVFCEKGFAVGLDAAAKALCARGKTTGMQAVLAPKMWAKGQTQQVLQYVADDCQLTLDVAKSAETDGRFAWMTRRGTASSFYLTGGRWLTVHEALQLPEPDTSWMTEPPWKRARFTEWLERQLV